MDIFESLKTMQFDINDHNPSLRKWGIGLPHMEETKKHLSEIQKERWKQGVYDAEKLRLSRIGFKQPDSQKQKVAEKLSSEWIITNPKGESFKIKNLHKFCKENGLDQGNMVKVSKGLIKQNKGWKCLKIES
jgi:hypothetical protein